MNPKISVIIPVYNVEKYLDRCVESVVNQTYKNLEIILIDDGSPDNCPKMCDEWASRDSRIRTVHRTNGGQSCARNAGLSIVTGDYVTFIDSDDWIALDMYESLHDLIIRYNADAVECKSVYAYESDRQRPLSVIQNYDSGSRLIEGRNQILECFMQSSTTSSGMYTVWNCLFKKEIACRYRFREGKVNEDIDYKYKALSDCKRFVISDCIGYFYFQSGNSSSSGKLKPKDFDLIEAADILCDLSDKEDYGNIRFLGRVKKARTPFSLLSKAVYFGVSDTIDANVINGLINEHRRSLPILLKSPMKTNRKVLALLFALNFGIAKGLIRLYKSLGGQPN